MSNVKFLWASDFINQRPDEYWMRVMQIAKNNSLARIKKCSQIMGRNEADGLSVAQMFYPCMQCTDVFFMDIDIC
jgi:tyrosyl-tRNA synthetase